MRILVVQESDWVNRGPHQNHHIMERLAEKGHDIRVIDFDIGWRNEEARTTVSSRMCLQDVGKVIEGSRVTVIRPSIIRLPIIEYLSLIVTHYREISRQVKEFNPNAIVGFGILNSWLAVRLARREGIPFVYYVIDELHRLVPQRVLRRLAGRIERSCMRRSTIVVSINKMLRDYTVSMGAAPEKTEIVEAGVDMQRYLKSGRKEIRDGLGLTDDDVVLFYMGWLYGFSGLREVALRLCSKGFDSNLMLMVIGRGEQFDELSRIKKERDLSDKILLFGWQPYEVVPQYLAASDICILPAHRNDIMKNIVPIKIYEYMAAGKPIIATRLPGLEKEFGYNAGLIFVDRPEDVVEKASELTAGCTLQIEGARARRYVERNDWNAIANKFETLVKGVNDNIND